MLRSFLKKLPILLTATLLLLPAGLLLSPRPAKAAASMYVSSPATVAVGGTVNVTIQVNTNGDSANAFDARITYPTSHFDAIRGSTSGSICTLWITQPEPDGGSATISCGRPGGFTGTGIVATIVLQAKTTGSATFGLSGCSVLANDGRGTNITGGCAGKTMTIEAAATPNPTPTPSSSTPTPSSTAGGGTKTPKPATSIVPTNTPKPVTTPRPPATPGAVGGSATVVPGGAGVGAEDPNAPGATPNVNAPDAQNLPDATPLPSVSAEPEGASERRTISQAFSDIFSSLRALKGMQGDFTGAVALLLTLIPFLALVLGILFFGYRLYSLDRRRRRTMDRLFEMELAELAALEGKMDLLAEKGAKGRDQYKEEFQKAKENILRQLKPDYGKPVEEATSAAAPAKEDTPPAASR